MKPSINPIAAEVMKNITPLFKQINTRFEGIDKRFDKLELEVRQTGIRTEQMDKKIDLALDLLKTTFQTEASVKNHEERIGSLETQMKLVQKSITR